MQQGVIYSASTKTCQINIWAPKLKSLEFFNLTTNIKNPLKKNKKGYWTGIIKDCQPGQNYYFLLNNRLERPDPFSFYQPQGVHGPSQIVDHSFEWTDQKWQNPPLDSYIIYELHIGTFTPEGTFKAAIEKLDYLKELGITGIEVMPVAQFPGSRNWGYDGAYLFSVQNTYGGPDNFKTFINTAHQKGIAVILDVVYNHFGPEGNYLGDYCPYHTDQYKTPWGRANNFDQAFSDEVREIFFQNALYWFEYFHLDALRLDAVHAIYDSSAKHFLKELNQLVKNYSIAINKNCFLIAESNQNDRQIITKPEIGGYDLSAQWNDDFHHALRAILTGEKQEYYQDYGSISQLVKAIKEGFVYDGQYSVFRNKTYGTNSTNIPGNKLIVFTQNHDQVGNRISGDRLILSIGFEAAKMVASLYLLIAYVPLLFMGEEYGESNPFLYFIAHSDPKLVKKIRNSRKSFFKQLKISGTPPDPQSETTFSNSKLDWKKIHNEPHNRMLALYKKLICIRKKYQSFKELTKHRQSVQTFGKKCLELKRWSKNEIFLIYINLSAEEQKIISSLELKGEWAIILNTAAKKWGGIIEQEASTVKKLNSLILQPYSAVILKKDLV